MICPLRAQSPVRRVATQLPATDRGCTVSSHLQQAPCSCCCGSHEDNILWWEIPYCNLHLERDKKCKRDTHVGQHNCCHLCASHGINVFDATVTFATRQDQDLLYPCFSDQKHIVIYVVHWQTGFDANYRVMHTTLVHTVSSDASTVTKASDNICTLHRQERVRKRNSVKCFSDILLSTALFQ